MLTFVISRLGSITGKNYPQNWQSVYILIWRECNVSRRASRARPKFSTQTPIFPTERDRLPHFLKQECCRGSEVVIHSCNCQVTHDSWSSANRRVLSCLFRASFVIYSMVSSSRGWELLDDWLFWDTQQRYLQHEDLRLANAAMMIALEYTVHCSSSPKDASLRNTYSLQIDGTIKIGQRCCKQLLRGCVRIIGQTLSVSILCVELWRKSDGTSGKRENSCHSKSIISTSIIEVEVLYFCQEWAEAGGY